MQNPFDLSGRVIVVTGATGALAGTAALDLVAAGATVAFLGRNRERVDDAVSAATAANLNGTAIGLVSDVTDREGLESAARELLSQTGKIDGLLNGAGGNQPGATIGPDKTVFDLNLDDYDKVLDLNLKGTLLPSLVFGKIFAEQGSGAIVNFSSASSAQALTRVLGYSNAKAAVDNLTRWMATDFAKKHGDRIRVNAVCPGFFIGKQNRALLLKEDGSLTERGEQIINKTPMGRFGEAPEVTGAIRFLLSDAARFITGQVIHIDGGFGIYSGV